MATLDDLMRLAALAQGGTGSDTAPRPLPQPSPALAPSALAVNQFGAPPTMPTAPELGDALMGPAGPLESIASRLPGNSIAGLLDLAGSILRGRSAYGDVRNRAALNEVPGVVAEQHAGQRYKEQTLADASANRRRLAANERASQLRSAIDAGGRRLDVLSGLLETPGIPPEKFARYKNEATTLAAKHKEWTQVLAGVLGDQSLAEAPAPVFPAVPSPVDYGRITKTSAAEAAGRGTGGPSAVMGGKDFKPEVVASKIVAGTAPADPSGYTRGQWGAIVSYIPEDFDLTKSMNDAKANRTFVATVNGRQFTMLRAAQQGIVDALKPLWDANEAVAKSAHLTGSRTLNRGVSLFGREGVLGHDAKIALTNRSSKAALTVEPLASVLRNGGMPTDQAQYLAEHIVSSDDATPPDVMRAQIISALEGMGLRKEAFDEVSPRGLEQDATLRGPRPNGALPPGADPNFDPTANGGVKVVPVQAHTRKAAKR